MPISARARFTEDDREVWHIDHADVTAMLAHPRFDEMMLAVAVRMTDAYQGQWPLNRIMNDRARVIAAITMLELHFTGGRNGFTVAQLREEARRHGICSPNRITALVGVLRLAGFLAPMPSADSRMRRLAPAEPFVTLHRERFRAQFALLTLVRPEMEPALAALDDPLFLGDLVHGFLAPWRLGFRATQCNPALESLIERDAAFAMLFALMVGREAGDSLQVAELARRFLVSRSHVLSVLREAQGHGWLGQARPGGTYYATPELTAAFRPFFALLLTAECNAITFALGRLKGREDSGELPLPIFALKRA